MNNVQFSVDFWAWAKAVVKVWDNEIFLVSEKKQAEGSQGIFENG